MYKDKGSGMIMYETFDELLTSKLLFVTECDEYYYMKPSLDDYYDERVYKVNKKTKEVSCMHCIDYMCDIESYTTSVNIEALRREYFGEDYPYIKIREPETVYISLYKVDKKSLKVMSDWYNLDYYKHTVKSKGKSVDVEKIKNQYDIGEPEYDEDGIIINGANRKTLQGLLLLPYNYEVMEYEGYYYVVSKL